CQKEINNEDEDRSTPEDSNVGGGKTDENLKETSLHCKEVFEDCNLSAEDAKATNTSAESRSSGSVKELLENNNATIKPMVVPSNSSTHETSGIPEKVEEETSQMLATMDSDSNESLIRKCVGNDKGGNLTPSKRKSTVVDKCSDVSATLVDDDNCNLIVDADPERLETSRPTKRIR
ncbi:helicase MOM1-like, partial [Trifolium medium]|nr:helicase MOM1-like [Trifolium medium]